jgi:hypothetical protein
LLPSCGSNIYSLCEKSVRVRALNILGSLDLWEFVQNGYEDPIEKRRDKLTLYLVSSALNNDILSA